MRRIALLGAALLPFIAFNVPTAGQQPATTASAPSAAQTPSPNAAASTATPAAELVNRYCVTCHNQKIAINGVNAGLQLDRADAAHPANSAAIWEKVIIKLRTQTMPPPGNRRPDGATYDAVASWLEGELDRSAAADPNPGSSILRRLNRLEYVNAVRDLLAVDVEAESVLPIDDQKFGFDNVSSAQSVTPVLLERYMSAGKEISSLAVGEPEVRPTSDTYPVDLFLEQGDRMSEDLPFGSRGGVAVRHHFPVDGEYTIKVVLQRNSRGYVRGLYEPHRIDFRVDGALVKSTKI